MTTKRGERVILVTGKLAEPALRRVADQLAQSGRVDPTVVVLNIQVAALMTADWVARKLELPVEGKVQSPESRVQSRRSQGKRARTWERVIVPGHCRGDLAPIARKLRMPVQAGPQDLHDLPEFFGMSGRPPVNLTQHNIEIIAEINHAPRLSIDQIVAMAKAYRADGADVIDIGCDPLPPSTSVTSQRRAWRGVAAAVRAVRALGVRVSIDTFHPTEIAAATGAGAELVLSVNSTNVRQVIAIARRQRWSARVEVVVVPDDPRDLTTIEPTLHSLREAGVRHRIDPVLEPIGLGFAASLGRYLEARRRWPEVPIMMGVGNLTEMTEVDSAGVNALLIGFCQELGIGSVLTTQVINWARSSVREIDAARRAMHHAVTRRTVPKRLNSGLVMLRDEKLRRNGPGVLSRLAASLTDRNLRLFADHDTGLLHAMNKDLHASERDPFVLVDRIMERAEIDPSHAFYLGFELAKASIALTLGKNYTQDQALRWGLMTREEVSHHDRRLRDKRQKAGAGGPGRGKATQGSGIRQGHPKK